MLDVTPGIAVLWHGFIGNVIRYQVSEDTAARREVVREGPFGSEKEIEKPFHSNEVVSSGWLQSGGSNSRQAI
jgi:hypothetical protein